MPSSADGSRILWTPDRPAGEYRFTGKAYLGQLPSGAAAITRGGSSPSNQILAWLTQIDAVRLAA